MIKIYTTSWCNPCRAAKQLLKSKEITFHEINIEEEGISRQELAQITGGMTVPQIVINGTNIGGFDKLMIMNQNGDLDKLIDQ